MNLNQTDDDLLKPEAAAKILAVSKPYIYKLAALGLLPCVRWSVPGAGGKRQVVRIKRGDVKEFISRHYNHREARMNEANPVD